MKRFNWIEDLALPAAAAVLVVTWLSDWMRWGVRAASPDPQAPALAPLTILIVMVLSAVAVRRALSTRQWIGPDDRLPRDPGGAVRRRALAAGLLTVMGALWFTYGTRFPAGYLRDLFEWDQFISPEFFVLVGTVYAWWRGVFLGRSRIPYHELERNFYGGIAALALLLVVNRFAPLLPAGEVLWTVLLYFAVGLSALTLASFERARRQQHAALGVRLTFNRYWLGTTAGVIGSVLLGGLAAAALLAPESLDRLRPMLELLDRAAEPAVFAFALLIGWLAIPMVYLAGLLLEVILIILARLPRFPEAPQLDSATVEVVAAVLNSTVVKYGGRGLTMLVVLGVLGALIWWALRRFKWLPAPDTDETRESILTGELLLNQLKHLLTARRRSRRASRPPFLALAEASEDARVVIRRAYQAMLEWAPAHHRARAPGETPAAFAAGLQQRVPGAGSALDVLTRAYLRARYAADAPSRDEAQQAQAAAQELTRTFPVKAR